MAAEAKIDEDGASRMLQAGESVRAVAHHFGVSTQAIYLAIREGRVIRPTQERAEPATGGQA